MQTRIFAHRGDSFHFAENTMPAFQAAVDLKVDVLEIDIHKSKDGQIIVTHDENLKRVTGMNALIKDLNYQEIRKLNAAAFRPEFDQTHIPLLTEVIDLIKDKDIILNVEFKNSQYHYPEIEQDVVNLIRKYQGLEEKILFSSLNHYSILKMREIGTIAELSLPFEEILINPCDYMLQLGIYTMNPHYNNLIRKDFVKIAHENNLKVNIWTVDEEVEIETCLRNHVDGLMTNNPKLALQIREKYKKNS